ncbi:MAG: nitronate monooxygenase [Candidatus Obscuribacterales bacterium]|nr:nitronate monooxygenase [Cyanobacteria bacterium HKST-UBA01]MCB9471632.1 nitronate monooxygenase [Candidatus Obscuribacterales bacterium]
MGVAVSNWRLARAVSAEGHLGVVSGTMLDNVFVRRLQDGDLSGDIRRALAAFPDRLMAERIYHRYHIPGGKQREAPYKSIPMHTARLTRDAQELLILANFVEVFLAKEGHNGLVGINFLEKIQLPTLPSLYGAMLARVDYVLMGAGIPKQIPEILDALSIRQSVSMKLHVEQFPGGDAREAVTRFDPAEFPDLGAGRLNRPKFVAVVSSNTLAEMLAKRSKVDGFVVENHTAGGHNAPPRGGIKLDDRGEPVYTARDSVDLGKMRSLGLPFWLAGSYGNDGKLKEALEEGAVGIQVGTPFAFCEESGFSDELKKEVLTRAINGDLSVSTDVLASSSNYPFKIASIPGTLSEDEVYESRERVCDLGYLRTLFFKEDGTIGYRCPGEPVDNYLRKGGRLEDTECRKCLCNGLMAAVDYPQVPKNGEVEKPLVTAGQSVNNIIRFLPPGKNSYSARDVVKLLVGALREPHYVF